MPLVFFLIIITVASVRGAPLATLEYRINGSQLLVTPAVLSVPKGIAGSVLVEVTTGGSTNASANSPLADGAYVEATLRGPSFAARRLISQVNQPLLLPSLSLVGDYQLDNIRLVDATSGQVRLEGNPASVPVRVFDEVLISRVTSRPLSLDEIKDKGIAIDEKNFRAVEFEVGFVLDGKTIPVKFPVVAPTFAQSTEIIPKAELDQKLAAAAAINQQIAATAELPPELEGSRLNIQIQGINFQRVEDVEENLALQIPPIPALMVIPGNIGYLNQFFSVQIFTENGAPQGSGLSVFNVQAELILPVGPDRIASTNYDSPGDDPLRFARIGPNKIIQPIQNIVRPGPDGKIGTSDDFGRIYPGESGTAEFLVEGLQEGLHVMDLTLTADLDGLAAGTIKIKGKAAGSVLVRNPKFSLAFTHPRTVRAGEPYSASVTILNTGNSPANLVSVTLPSTSLSGGVLESSSTVELGNLLPGQSATATWRIRAQRTGAISFSNLTTGDDSVQGRFRLTMGIDERGVALSPDVIAMPDYVNSLPTNLVTAAIRLLGQALSAATAAQLPPGVKGVTRAIVTRRVLELAEAGQRVRYNDPLKRVLADLLLDWQGGRNYNAGFDQILRTTNAGREWRDAMMAEMEALDLGDGNARLAERAGDLAGRGESFAVATDNAGQTEITFGDGQTGSVPPAGDNVRATYRGGRGSWEVSYTSNPVVYWHVTNNLPPVELTLLLANTNGTAKLFRWSLAGAPPTACYSYAITNVTGLLSVDTNCDAIVDATLNAVITPVNELAPDLIAALQDEKVLAGRPAVRCDAVYDPPQENYGTILAVLFSKPMTQDRVNVPAAYRFENGNSGGSVQIQPGGRVALVNMRQPFSALVPRTVTVTNLADSRGNPLGTVARTVQSSLTFGTVVRGRVVRADGSPAAGVPVTLTVFDSEGSGFECVPYTVRVAQVYSDEQGRFQFDYVIAGLNYSISATDTSGLSPDVIATILGSVAGDEFARDRLLALANSPSVQNTLLAAFAVGALPEAIAKVEGLDRALLRDILTPGSPRIGAETAVALRFRGRGTVSGTVFASDGITPLSQVAVNLFPDPDSRERGRGVFSDNKGRFAFEGVPLGVFTIAATNSVGQARIVAGLLDQFGQIKDVPIVLSTNLVLRANLRGRVLETDNATPHPGATVYVGNFNDQGKLANIVAVLTTDSGGYWAADGIPASGYDVVGVSVDGRRKGERRGVVAAPGAPTLISIALQSRATVIGRVVFDNGTPATNALVAGGESLVRTDVSGLFTMPGVPTGQRSISAGVERNPAAGIDFPRLGSASLEVVAGIENYVVIRLRPAGTLFGQVRDANGTPVPNVRVMIPQEGGFMWVDADNQGRYIFEGMGLDEYTLSAGGTAPPVANTDTSGLISKIREGSEEEVLAAIGEALAIFTGASDPYLNGEGAAYNPAQWGFLKARIRFDGDKAEANIRFFRSGTIAGKILNGQGVPIGARVRLTGIGPLPNGAPAMRIRGELNSDPALGTFTFPNSTFVGAWGLQAASPFYPVVLTTSGQTSDLNANETNVVLQFPAVQDVNGRLVGAVFLPDGSLAGSNVNVKISFGSDYIIKTDTNSFYDTQIKLPAGGYRVEAEDPRTGLKGLATVNLVAGITNVCHVQLIGKGGLAIVVRYANGQPATNASVEVVQGSYPGDRYTGTTDTNGVLDLQNIFAGSYAVSASMVSGPSTIMGRAGGTVAANQTAVVAITLTPTGTLRGMFVKRDLVTPIGFAQIGLGNLGFATTDASGKFEVAGVPLGTYRLVSQDPVSGVGAVTTVTLSFDGEVRDVQLVEQARGEIAGAVINSYGNNYVPGALVTARFSDGLTASRTVTCGPDGRFSFPGSPAGGFTLDAEDTVTHLRGSRSGTLAENVATINQDVPLQSLAVIAGLVLQPDGLTPATNVTVGLLNGPRAASSDTDAEGRVLFVDMPLGQYLLRANDRALSANRSVAVTNVSLASGGTTNLVTVVLSGVGSLSGQVWLSDGLTVASGAEVVLTLNSVLFGGQTETRLADAQGRYAFSNIALGPYRVSAIAQALAASYNGNIISNGQADIGNLVLGASGAVKGRLVRADGATPVTDIDVLLSFQSQSGLPGRAFARSDTNGAFQLNNIPLGAFSFEAQVPAFGGVARFNSALVTNGQTNDLGNVSLDEEDPRVVMVTPENTAVGIPITNLVDLVFSEAMSSNSINPNGIYLRLSGSTNSVPATVQLFPDPTNSLMRRVRLTPIAPLLSEKTYEIIVIDGDRKNALGSVIATGPTDLVGRPLVAPFVSRFTTADNDPPLLVSIFPTNSMMQIDTRSVMRLSFNEAVRDSNYVVAVNGPGGPVTGTTAVGLNGLAVNFVPTAALAPNAVYTLVASNIFDLAGNRAAGEPFVASFATLDTIGPDIATLVITNNRLPIALSTVPVAAVLATNEPGVTVRFTQDFVPVGVITNSPFQANVTLPASGQTTVRAIATDRFGNDGPFAELTITILSNQPPTVQLVRGNPSSGSLANGQAFTIVASATDDVAVTNLTVVGLGVVSFATNFPDGSARTIFLRVPNDIAPGGLFQFQAQATDSTGAKSPAVVLDLTITDGAAPGLTILSPTNNALLDPAQPLTLLVASSDNGSSHKLELNISGGIQYTQVLNLTSAPNVTVTNSFTVPLAGAPTSGVTLFAVVKATDSVLNQSSASQLFRLPDTQPPMIALVNPTNGAPRQSLWLNEVVLQFSEGVISNSISTNTIQLVNNAGLVPFSLLHTGDSAVVKILLTSLPLQPGTTYTNLLLPGINDPVGNTVSSREAITFMTASISADMPTNNARVVPGQTFPVSVSLDTGLGADFLRFNFYTNSPMDVPVTLATTNVTLSLKLPTNASSAILQIEAHKLASSTYVLPLITFNVRPRDGDDDGDGLPNGYEADMGLNPFVNDASLDPDHDGLTNAQEFQKGADPLNPDTDGDGILDGLDANPMVPNLRPIAGTSVAGFALNFDGTNDYINVPYNSGNPLFSLSTRFTFEAWVKPYGGGPLIERQQCGSTWPVTELSLGGSNSNLTISLLLNYANNNTYSTFISSEVVPTNRWSHIAATYDQVSQSVQLFLNGTNVLTTNYNQSLFQPSTPFWIGGLPKPVGQNSCGESYLAAVIDEVRIWNVARPEAELRRDKGIQLFGNETGLVGYWRLTEGTGGVSADSSTNANAAVLGGGISDAQPTWIASGAELFEQRATNSMNTDMPMTLVVTDGDPGDTLSASITVTPANGQLFQTTDGTNRGSLILNVPTTVTSSNRQVIYVPNDGFIGTDTFQFLGYDGKVSSAAPAAVFVKINVPSNLGRSPTFDAPPTLEIVEQVLTNFTVTARDADGNLASLRVAAIPGPLELSGLTARFINLSFTPGALSQVDFNATPTLVTNVSNLDFPNTSSAPWPGNPVQTAQVAARFNGYLSVPTDGNYTFYLNSDDGAQVILDGQVVASRDNGAGEITGNRTLLAGLYEIEVRHFNGGGPGSLTLSWSGPSLGRQVIPASAFNLSWPVLRWAQSGSPNLILTNDQARIDAPITLVSGLGRTSQLQIIAFDRDLFSATQLVTVITLGDLDHDGIPDRDDLDIDGDGLLNTQEIALGTNPRNPDTDGDGIPDGLDPRPLSPNQAPIALLAGARTALSFDGVNDFAERASPTSALNIGNSNWTVSAWIRTADTNNRTMTIVSRYECGWNNCGSPDGSAVSYWALYLNANGTLVFGARSDGATGDAYYATGTNDVRDGQWHQVAGVINRTNQTVSVFLDGQMLSSTPAPLLANINDAGSPFSVGRTYRAIWGSPGEYFSGLLSDIQVWNVVRSSADLLAEMTVPLAGNEPGLVGYWSFQENGGFVATNKAAGTNDLVLGDADPTRPQRLAFLEQSGTADRVITLGGVDPEGDPVKAIVTALPTAGALYQTLDGTNRGARITAVPATISNINKQVVFAPPPGFNALQLFHYQVSDGFALSSNLVVGFWAKALPYTDTDGDGMPDVYEVANGLNPEINDAGADPDHDGLTNLQEYLRGTNPQNPDTDGDGLLDGAEILAGTKPLDFDTDGDGLMDGFDPNPMTVAAGLTFVGPTNVVLMEGESTNLTFEVTSTNGAVLVMGSAPTNPPPTFAAQTSLQFKNTSTNGSAKMVVQLNPLHDAAGEYHLTLRAAAADGKSGVLDVVITVQNNSALVLNRWKDPVNGNWSDASKWTVGLPDSNHVAVIDVPGTYTVNLDSTVNVTGVVLGHSNATLMVVQNVAVNAPMEVRSGTVQFPQGNYRTLTINKPLVNNGVIQMLSRYYSSSITGNGMIENAGLITAALGPGLGGDEFVLDVPVHVAASGRFLLPVNVYGRVTVPRDALIEGSLELQSGARLYYLNNGGVSRMNLLAGSRVIGTGTLRLDGANCLAVESILSMPLQLELNDTSAVVGNGILRVTGPHLMYGHYAARLVIARDAALTLRNTRWGTNVLIETGATLALGADNYYTLTADGVVTNRGTLRQVANYYTSTIAGSGRIENEGLMDLAVGIGGYSSGSPGSLNVLVNVAASGSLRINTNGFLRLGSGGGLSVAGTLEVQSGGRLRMDDVGYARDLVLQSAAQVQGDGVLQFECSNRLLLYGDMTMPFHLELNCNSSVAGDGVLRVVGTHLMYGNYASRMVIASNAVLTLRNTRWGTNVLIETGAALALGTDNYYTLTADGVVTNRGTLRQVANYYTSTIAGSGRIENEGLMDLAVGIGGYSSGSPGSLNVLVNVAASGRLRVNTNGFLRLGSGGGLSVAGTLEVQSGGRLRMDDVGYARDLVLQPTAQAQGDGVLQFECSNRLLLNGDLTMPFHLELNCNSSVAGDGVLRVVGTHLMYGNYASRMVIASNAVLTLRNTRWGNNVLIETGATLALGTDNYYTLTADGVVTNRGTLRQVANYYTSTMTGSGRIENEGLMDFSVGVGGYSGAEGNIYLPINVTSAGRFLIPVNGYVRFASGGILTVAGVSEVQNGARLRYEYNGVSRDLTLLGGGTMTGAGSTQIEGYNRLLVAGNATLAGGLLNMLGGSQVGGAGKLTVANGATMRFDHSATVEGSLQVAGTFTQSSSGVITRVNGTLILDGTGVLNLPGLLSAGAFINNGGTVNGNLRTDGDLVITKWISPISGNWSQPTNWTAGVPDSSKMAVVDVAGTYTITVDVDTTMASLQFGAATGTQTLRNVNRTLTIINPSTIGVNGRFELAGGTLAGVGNMTISGVLDWSAGTMSDSGVTRLAPNSACTISGSSTKFLSWGRRFENGGNLLWQDGNILVAGGDASSAAIANLAGGVFEIQADRTYQDNCNETLLFENDGVVRKTGGTGVTSLSTWNCGSNSRVTHNRGVMEVLSGTLRIYVLNAIAQHTGTFVVASNATLEFAGIGTHNLANPLNLPGTLRVSGPTVNVTGGVKAPTLVMTGGGVIASGDTVVDQANFSGGTYVFNGLGSVTNLTLTGGYVGGTNLVVVQSNLVWTSGGMSGAGTLRLAAGATGTLSSASTKELWTGKRFENAGTVFWQDGDIIVYGGGSGTIANLAGGLFEIQSDRVYRDNCNETVIFENDGLVRKTAGTGVTSLSVWNCGSYSRVTHNRGVMEVLNGTLRIYVLNATAQHTGNFVVATNATLEFAGSGTQNLANSLNLPGTLRVSGPTVNVAGTLKTPALIMTGGGVIASGDTVVDQAVFSGGTYYFNGLGSVTNLTLSGGYAGGTNLVVVQSNLVWTSGGMSGTGTLRLAAGATGTLSSANTKELWTGKRFENAGTVFWQDGDIIVYGGGSGTMANLAGGLFEIQSDRVYRDNCNETVVFENDGLVRKTAGTGATSLSIWNCGSYSRVTHNRGVMEVLSGTLRIYVLNATAQHTGSFFVTNNSVLEFAGVGTQTITGQIQGNGLVYVSGSTVVDNEPINLLRLYINGGSWVANTNATISSLQLSSGSIGGAGILEISSNLTWTSGTMFGNGITRLLGGSSNVVSSANTKYLQDGRRLENAGTLLWLDGEFNTVGSGGAIANLMNGLFEIQCDRVFRDSCNNTVVFENDGTVRKTAGTGVTALGQVNCGSGLRVVHNRGLMEVLSGMLLLNAYNSTAQHSGTFFVTNNSVLEFGGNGTQVISGQMQGEGLVRLSSSTVTMNSVQRMSRLQITGGNWSANTNLLVNYLQLDGGSLSGLGLVEVVSNLTWTGGTMMSSNTTRTLAGSSNVVSTGNTKYLQDGRRMENAGVMVWLDGEFNTVGFGGTIANLAGGLFEIRCDRIFRDSCNNTVAFENDGTVRKTAGTGVSALGQVNCGSGSRVVHNRGLMEVLSGTLFLNAYNSTAQHSGTFFVTNNSVLEFGGNGTQVISSQMQGEGLVRLSSSTVTMNSVQILSRLQITGGNWSANTNLLVNYLQLDGGSLSGLGLVEVVSNLTWTGGTMMNSNTTRTLAGSSNVVSTGNTKFLQDGRRLENAGVMMWLDGEFNAAGSGGTIANLAGGLFEIRCDRIFRDSCNNTVVFENDGTVRKTAGTGVTALGSVNCGSGSRVVHNRGVMEALSGTLRLQTYFATGNHSGAFIISSNAVLEFNSGTHTLNPGTTFDGDGILRFQTPITLGTNISLGRLQVSFESSATLSGNYAISNSPGGVITISKTMIVPGSMSIGGTLNVTNPSFTLTINDMLTLEASGIINNSSTIRTLVFVNNGGTVNGAAVVIQTGLAPHIVSISVGASGSIQKANPALSGAPLLSGLTRNVVINWRAASGLNFMVETSSDFITWIAVPATVVETAPGKYSSVLDPADHKLGLFRIRQVVR